MNRPLIITIIVLVLIILGVLIFIALSGGNGEVIDMPPSLYNCSSDIYNCGDFTTQAQAQAVYDYCSPEGAGDVHRLDNDGDGVVCENLP